MNFVIFGLSISSAWGNGHATLLRGLFKSLSRKGHKIHFFERDTPYYAIHRDAWSFPYAELHLYSDWRHIAAHASALLREADVGMVTSYCADGIAACDLVLNTAIERRIFYDLDTPVTLDRLEQGISVPYIPTGGLGDFDLVLSYAGGTTLDRIHRGLAARRAATLYGWVDPEIHHRVTPNPQFEADLSYLGTYSGDRQAAFEELLLAPSRDLPDRRFVIGGAMYPEPRHWPVNVRHFEHVVPPRHSEFYSSSPLTLSVTRASMAASGYCPSGRLFEAAACGTAVLSDWWPGLDTFLEPGEEILIARDRADTIAALNSANLAAIGQRARERALDCHTADLRAERLLSLIQNPVDERESERPLSFAARGA